MTASGSVTLLSSSSAKTARIPALPRALRRRAALHGIDRLCRFVDHCPDMPAGMAAADVIDVQPSHSTAPRRKRSARARQFAEFMFSPHSVAEAIRGVYTSLLAGELAAPRPSKLMKNSNPVGNSAAGLAEPR
jgi:hypothetical protein